MDKKLVWEIVIEEGESALNALKYSEAEVIFSEVMNSHNVPYPFEKTIIFLWIIAIFHLKGFFSLKRILFLTKFGEYTEFQKSLFYLLEITQNKEEYNNAIKHIEGTLKRKPELINEYKKYLIHLPLDFQIIFKMRFY